MAKGGELYGKRLLILGGTYASYDLVRIAQSMGAYVIVADDAPTETRVAKKIADEAVKISTDDMDGLTELVTTRGIDGAFCGPSEFNLQNLFRLCERTGLPCYSDLARWHRTADKASFKHYCAAHGIETPRAYALEDFDGPRGDAPMEPVIVKPVDGSSSRGLSLCRTREEVRRAYQHALDESPAKRVIIEDYIDNDGAIFSFRYILRNGTFTPYMGFDTYVVDPDDTHALISAFTYFPSAYTRYWLDVLDPKVRAMFTDMGLRDGVAFIQASPYRGKLYCHEMGYRLSGGFIYKMTEPVLGINDVKMMLRFALGLPMLDTVSWNREDLLMPSTVAAQLMIPLEPGTVAEVRGLEALKEREGVVDFLQYYREGDTVPPEVRGTLGQHFGRFTLTAPDAETMLTRIRDIQTTLSILDTSGREMYRRRFDLSRMHSASPKPRDN